MTGAKKKASTALTHALCVTALSAVSSAAGDWSYEGNRGPAHWGSLDPAFATCANGTEQSPIDLAGGQLRDLSAIAFHYAPSSITIVNNGHTIQVNLDPGRGIVLQEARYELTQLHFHHASEHTMNGVRFPMELHLVHRSDDGALAVVAVLYREGRVNEALEPIWKHLPPEPVPAAVVPGTVDLAALLPDRRTSWRYRGSLTTPPCTEGVSWVVLTEPVALSAAQITAFGAIYPDNYRPVQPLGNRVLARDDRAP